MKLKLYQVDAFAEKLFTGNPAAVVPLGGEWLDAAVMQRIAMENNLAETAFYIRRDGKYHIRWFTPEIEVDLCGHATLAASHVLFEHEGFSGDTLVFGSRSGDLSVAREGELLALNFPADQVKKVKLSKPLAAYKGRHDYMLVFKNEAQIKDIKPDFAAVNKVPARGVMVTARGDTVDFVSRFFAPQSGIFEDPVTGSAHTTLAPYWRDALGTRDMTALQLSPRG
ncbi:MAG TPA: PhzF family phenazine biosynthesis protein, partial [Candidatus Edwardsbacteria bacterium]|nr:PhzF family phenazine biosynthesis protein [Candidatus Edwardsbacteria bacterium]